jgi:hypothetical protein
MTRSLYSGGDNPTRFYFPDGQEAGETYRLVHNAGDGLGSILAKRYRMPTTRDGQLADIDEYQLFGDIVSAHGWIADGCGSQAAWDAYFSEPIAGLAIVEQAAEPAPATPPRTRKPKASASA